MRILYIAVSIFFSATLCSQNHWETAIFAEDYWDYLVPIVEVPSNWNEIGFDNSDWSTGPGGFGYGDVKKKIAEAAGDYFRDAWQRRAEMENDAGYVQDVLNAGAAKARIKCREVLDRVQKATGLVR